MPLQTERELQIFTSLGEDALVLDAFSLTEELGRPFQLTIRVRLGKPDADVYSLVNKVVSIRIKRLDDKQRYIHGFVAGISEPGAGRSARVYTLTVVPALWYLSQRSDCRIFQDMSVVDIATKIFNQHGLEFMFKIEGTPRKWKYLTQYRESDLNFVMRLFEQEGMTFFFKHDDKKQLLVIVNSLAGFEKIPGYDNIDYHDPDSAVQHDAIHEWRVSMGMQTKQVALTDYDFIAPNKNLLKTKALNFPHVAPKSELFDYPGEYWEPAEGDDYAAVRAQELEAHAQVYSGEAICRALTAGAKFTMQDPTAALATGMAQEYLITSVHITGRNDEFASGSSGGGSHVHTTLSAISAKRMFRTRRTTPRPSVGGPQTATVVGASGEDIHTDEHGRIKVKFNWDRYSELDDKASCWIRCSQGWAGHKWGSFFLPRVGQEVIVDFLDGDPDRPIVTGRVHNGLNCPPYALPGMKTVSTIKTLSTPDGGGFNEVRFEDKKGSEMLFVHAEMDHDLRVKKDMKVWIGNERHEIITKNSNHKIDGALSIAVKEAMKVAVEGDYSLKLAGGYKLELGAQHSIKCKGELVQKVTGNVTVDSSGAVFIKASSGLVLDCSAGITLKCGGSSVVLDSSGVTVKGSKVTIDGTMVMIASGPGSPPGAGSAGSPQAPDKPTEAMAAINAEPGEMAKRETEIAKREDVKLEKAQVAAKKNSEEKKEEAKKTWYEFKVIGPDGEAIKEEPVKIKLKNGKTLSMKTDSQGKARVNDVEQGDVQGIELHEREEAEYGKVADIKSGDPTKPFAQEEEKKPETEPAPAAEPVEEEKDPEEGQAAG